MAVSPYIRKVRQHIGTDLLLLPSVAVFPIREDGQLLLVQDSATRLWQTAGGTVEPDEPPRDAAVREVFEEAGVTVELGDLIDVIGGPQFRLTYPNGDQTAYVTIAFDAVVTSGTPAPDNDETCAVGWWPPSELGQVPINEFTKSLVRWPTIARRLGLLGA